MDMDVANKFAKEMAEAIAAAIAANEQVEAVREKARNAGFDLRISLEAKVGFVNRHSGVSVTKITTPSRMITGSKAFDLTTNDRRLLHSLRIGAGEAPAKEADKT